jgi:hypothetical protein
VSDDVIVRVLAAGGGARVLSAGGNFCAALTAEGGLVLWVASYILKYMEFRV